LIVPMKKVSLLVMDKNKEDALERLRDLGVVHLLKKNVSSPNLTKLLNRYNQIESASGILDSFKPKKGKETEPLAGKGELATRILALSERRKRLEDYMFSHQREYTRFARWGDFNPKDFAYLAEHGVNAFLYELPIDSYESIVGDVPVITLAADKKNNVIRFLAFDKIPNKYPYPLPERPLVVVEELNVLRQVEKNKIEAELASLYPLKKQLEKERKAVLVDIEFETAKAGMEQIKDDSSGGELSVSWISGYAPEPELGALKRAASENNWAICALDPEKDDEEVPTKLKNSKFTTLIYPVTGFLELIPGYREKDISIWFLLFFTLFFAMIFGDAAYGIILLLIAIIAIAKTSKKGVYIGLKLLLLLSIANIVWGTLVCSWFGLDTALLPQFLQNISLPLIVNVSSDPAWLPVYNANNFWIQSGLVHSFTDLDVMAKAIDTDMMLFCFSIALVQLSIAHIVNITHLIRSPKVFAEIGRLGILFGIYFVILSLIVFNTGFEGVKPWQLYITIAGFTLLFIFGSYEGSLIKSILTSCSNFITVVLNITNVFSDIMSYIRLWAVGLASASIAGIINDFASPLFSRFVFFAFGLFLFAFGHGFNMVLNVLSILVHGVRLNMLEFSTHVGLNWTGFAYKPFAKR